MVDKTNKHFDTANTTNGQEHSDNIEIDFAELDKKMEELVFTIKDFAINNIRNQKQMKKDEKVEEKHNKKPVKKLDIDKIRKAIIEATEIAKSKQKK